MLLTVQVKLVKSTKQFNDINTTATGFEGGERIPTGQLAVTHNNAVYNASTVYAVVLQLL